VTLACLVVAGVGDAEPRPLYKPPRLLICPQHGVSVLWTFLEAALLKLRRCPIKLVD
jgi:hypothetical protein